MSGHTPGPWHFAINEKCAHAVILGKRGDGDVRALDGLGELCFVNCAVDPNAVMFSPMLPEQVANARVMSAGAEMLEALRLCEDIIDDFVAHLSHEEQEDDPEVGEALRLARAAIAKALGK